MPNYMCAKCQKSMGETNFYTYKDGQKVELCKKCLTLHIDNFNPDTYLWLLEKMDVPYVEEEWNVLRDRAFAKDPYKMNGMSVFGKYLSKMRLKKWKDYTWADTEVLKQKKADDLASVTLDPETATLKEEELKRQLDSGAISDAQYQTLMSTEVLNKDLDYSAAAIGVNNAYDENQFLSEADLDIGDELTQEDKLYLATKWGRLYKPSEWLALEKKYNDMMESFDIHDADTKNVLIHLCKTDLKMNQAIDCGDLDGYQKLSRVYDALRKSAKFTAAQNKEKETQDFDSIGAIVAFCEKEGGAIPRFSNDTPLDKADEAITDIKKYLKNLIYNDTNIAQQIENYLKQLSLSQQQKADRDKAKEMGLDYVPISDKDLADFSDMISEQLGADMMDAEEDE